MKFLVIFVSLFSLTAVAQPMGKRIKKPEPIVASSQGASASTGKASVMSPPVATASSVSIGSVPWEGANSVYVQLIPYVSSVGFAAHYEKMSSEYLGIGGGITFLPKKTDSDSVAPGLLAFEANVRGHLGFGNLDLFVAPGLALQVVDIPNGLGVPGSSGSSGSSESKTTIGSMLAVGGLYQFSPQVGVGVEHVWINPWFEKRAQYAMAGQFAFGSRSSFVVRFSF